MAPRCKKQNKKNISKQTGKTKKDIYRNYSSGNISEAIRLVKEESYSIYKAAKNQGIPWSTLKNYIVKHENEINKPVTLPKLGRPFALPVDAEQKLFNYITEMQELGFGLTVIQIRTIAFQLAGVLGRENFFSKDQTTASKWWWSSFKKRYILTLRTPENLSAYRASMANPHMISDFYDKLEDLLKTLNISGKGYLLWNVDETGLKYVVKSGKVVAQIGKKYIYKRTYSDQSEIHTLVGCVNASGCYNPPFLIFKGIRGQDSLMNNCLPNTVVKLSPKGWINSDLFLDWFNHFIKFIPPERPVVLLMDSHGSHITPAILELAKANDIFILTFPAHCSHLLQPLDVAVYKSLKKEWEKNLNSYMRQHPHEKPNRSNFHDIFNNAFVNSFTVSNIRSGFMKSGIEPFNRNIIPEAAMAPSKLTERGPVTDTTEPAPSTSTKEGISTEEVLKVPRAPKPTTRKRKHKDSSAKIHTPPNKMSEKSENCNDEDDWICRTCQHSFSQDLKRQNGAKWIQCSFCLRTYHEHCQNQTINDKEESMIFMCDDCYEMEVNY